MRYRSCPGRCVLWNTQTSSTYEPTSAGWSWAITSMQTKSWSTSPRAECRAHPDVLVLGCQIYCKAAKWEYALAVAEGLTEGTPNDPRGWIWLCKTLYFSKRIQQAYDIATAK